MLKSYKIKFLGTSSGQSIPRKDCDCLQCQSKDKKDKRLQPSILINDKILIDAGPDILKQLTNTQITNLDSIIITHEHSDHVGGLKYLLQVNRDLRIIRMKPGQHFKLLGVDFFAFKVPHSNVVPTVGLEIAEKIVYIPDSVSLNLALKYLKEVKVAILDGSIFDRSFGGHLATKEIIAITTPFKNLKKIYFSHNGHNRKSHKEMVKLVQATGDKRYTLAYDGLELEI
ncbi:MAG: MBL fold metallo-hydrolase [Patescibacteria group bacterium]